MDICLYEEHYTQWKIKLQSLFPTQKGKIRVHFYAKSTMKYAHVRRTVPGTPPVGAAVPAGYDIRYGAGFTRHNFDTSLAIYRKADIMMA